MKIEEVITLYEFLANSGWIGILGAWFMMVVIVMLIFVFAKDKIISLLENKLKIVLLGVFGLVTVGFMFLCLEAISRRNLLVIANCVKSECVMYGYKVVSFSSINNDFHCDCSEDDITELLKKHPAEFIQVKTDDDSAGVRIIDEKALAAISQYNQSHLPFIKSRILDYMQQHKVDSITYRYVRDSINSDFDDEWIELMVSQYDSLFIPFNSLEDKKYRDTHGIKLRRKSKPLRMK